MRKRRLRLILILLSPLLVLLALALIAGLFLVFEHLRGSIALSRYQKALSAKGEKLWPQDLVRTNQAGENGAPELAAAIASFKDGTVLPDHPLRRMKILPSGRAIVCFREPQLVDESYGGDENAPVKITNTWEQVFADLEANAKPLEQVRRALAMPVFDHHLDYSNAPSMSLSHLASVKGLAAWLGAGVQLKLQEGNNAEALGYLVDQIRLLRSIADDQLLISELVRIAIAAIARNDTWEALQAEGWSDAQLLEIQQAWEAQAFATTFVASLEGERVFSMVAWKQMHESNEQAIQILFGMEDFFGSDSKDSTWRTTLESLPNGEKLVEFLRKEVYCRVWRFAWLDQHELRYLKGLQRLIDFARSAATNKSALLVRGDIDRLTEETLPRGFYDRLRFPEFGSLVSLSRTVDRAMRAETDRSMILAAVAIARYRLQHKAGPATLEGLVPAFLPAVPTDYMDGKPIKYRPEADGAFLLYSAGQDGLDDGGDDTQTPDQVNRANLWNRKDYIWPRAALPEEVEAYRAGGAN